MGTTSEAENTLRGWMADGTYGPGAKLPSERSLAEQLGAARTTLRIWSEAIPLRCGASLR